MISKITFVKVIAYIIGIMIIKMEKYVLYNNHVMIF